MTRLTLILAWWAAPMVVVVVACLNLAHPALHALGLEGGTLDVMLPYLNGWAHEIGCSCRTHRTVVR